MSLATMHILVYNMLEILRKECHTVVLVIFATVSEKQKVKSKKRAGMNHLGCV